MEINELVSKSKKNKSKQYKIIIIDDSALMRSVISDIISRDERFKVVGTARDGIEGIEKLIENNGKYDIVMLDINMPRLNGLEVLKSIKRYKLKCEVIMVSSLLEEGAKETILALEIGALDFVHKPTGVLGNERRDFERKLLHSLEGAVHSIDSSHRHNVVADVIHGLEGLHRHQKTEHTAHTGEVVHKPNIPGGVRKVGDSKKLVAVACSTGGPKALKEVIPKLPGNLDAPVAIVQHMPAGFTQSLAERLNELSKVKVKEAADGDILKKGHVYIAPGGKQLRIVDTPSGQAAFKITDEPPRDGLRPCGNIMFESIVNTTFEHITCVVLTGMGSDGKNGIQKLSQNKDIYVIAQDATTSVVYGMPRAVAKAGLTHEVVPLCDVAGAIIKNAGVLSDGR